MKPYPHGEIRRELTEVAIKEIQSRWTWTRRKVPSLHLLQQLLLLPPTIVWQKRYYKKREHKREECEKGFNILFKDSSFLLVGFDEHTWVADEMRVSSSQYGSHSFRVDKSDKPKHSFLLVWNPNILHSSKIPTITTNITKYPPNFLINSNA